MIVLALLFYVIGSIPFGLIITRVFGAGDIRTIGSGNIGATNVLRTGRAGLAALTLFLDTMKAWVPLSLVSDLSMELRLGLGLCLVLGHCFSLFLKCRGGKGVATTWGVYGGLAPMLGLYFALIWLVVAAISRYSSVSALSAVVIMPFLFYFSYGIGSLWEGCLLLILSALVIFRHRDNIKRLFAGEESKIHLKRQK